MNKFDLYATPAYADFCMEACIDPDDPDSHDVFGDNWEGGIGEIGICSKCGNAASAEFEEATTVIPCGDENVGVREWELTGSGCCGADICDARGDWIAETNNG